jgi:hypothetical protein
MLGNASYLIGNLAILIVVEPDDNEITTSGRFRYHLLALLQDNQGCVLR